MFVLSLCQVSKTKSTIFCDPYYYSTLYREGAALFPFKQACLTASDILPDVSNKPGNSTRQPESSTATHGSARQDSCRTKFSSQ